MEFSDFQLLFLGAFILSIVLILLQACLNRIRNSQAQVLRFEEERQELLSS